MIQQTFLENTDWEIENENGKWEDFSGVRILENDEDFTILKILTQNGFWIECTDNHTLYYDVDMEVLAKNLKLGDYILTQTGLDEIVDIHESTEHIVYDIINTDSGKTLTNGIISHNCDEFAHVQKNQCICGDETVDLKHGDQIKRVKLEDLHKALEKK